ncbi:hypothetical protein RRG08_042753 [Elysia crispata]|uniref:Uncharacterized protein n=1 Tax=Elysia crispata TaxID=231223 RepID=A0AAE0XRK3_9GAST|nr:hypothetical protein RRG08_042753 [Elysia crispata]
MILGWSLEKIISRRGCLVQDFDMIGHLKEHVLLHGHHVKRKGLLRAPSNCPFERQCCHSVVCLCHQFVRPFTVIEGLSLTQVELLLLNQIAELLGK